MHNDVLSSPLLLTKHETGEKEKQREDIWDKRRKNEAKK